MKLILVLLAVLLAKSESLSTDDIAYSEEFQELNLPHGKLESLMWINTNDSISVDYKKMHDIFSNVELVDRKIVAILMNGAFRKGKKLYYSKS